MHKTRITALVAAALMTLLVLTPPLLDAATAPRRTVSDSDRRKAQYAFMEAQVQKYKGNMGAFHDLTRYAHLLDPDNSVVAYYYGYCLLTMNNTSPSAVEHGLALMKRHVDTYPADQNEVTFYSDANLLLGHPEEGIAVLRRLASHNNSKTETLMRLASAYSRIDDHRGALAIYDTVEMRQGKSLELTSQKVNELMEMADTAGTIAEVRSLLATAPTNSSYNVIMGSVFAGYHFTDSAIHYMDRAIELDPEDARVYLAKAQVYDYLGDSVQVNNQIYSALISPTLNVDTKMDVLVNYANTLLQRNDSSGRVDSLFNVMLTQHPHEAKIHAVYGEFLAFTDHLPAAVEQMQYAVEMEPADIKSWSRLVTFNILNGDYPAAIKAGERALEYNPSDMDLYAILGGSYFQMDEYDKALQMYRHVLENTDSTETNIRAQVTCGMGDVYAERGDTARAVASYEQSLDILPTSSTLNNYAYFLAVRDMDLDKAERMAALAVKEDSSSDTFLDTYAWVYFKKKNYAMALLYIKSAIEFSDSPSYELFDHYGDILYFNEERDAAVAQWEKALELAPTNELIGRKVAQKQYFEK